MLPRAALGAILCIGLWAYSVPTWAQEEMLAVDKQACLTKFHIDPKGTDVQGFTEPAERSCHVQIRNGHRFPDKRCTPGALNPTVTEEVLRSPDFRTDCTRNMGTSEDAKKIIFKWYNVTEDETCEMDHFVSLEIGGSDMLMNLWPQCGPPGSTGLARDFKQKDSVELHLGDQVRLGEARGGLSQDQARKAVTKDWTVLIAAAKKSEASKKGKK